MGGDDQQSRSMPLSTSGVTPEVVTVVTAW
jgi:hypothetical protein